MKQGSADDPFADDTTEETESDTEPELETDSQGTETGLASTETGLSTGTTTSSQNRSLPYIHSRNGVKDGRTQRPIFLRDHIEAGIDDLLAQMEEEFGEDVYKTDITEAAMAVAQENPGLVREKLDEWGYGWD
ncbi:hypothetical protein [Halobellus ordinarius]|uniref:hypothetical protein n=1 Tax=Halobellus ordinarius TaxID=3075120 RepID=UPI0028807246|nr:hypothetical protein [Halobellus sp. ZY16]